MVTRLRSGVASTFYSLAIPEFRFLWLGSVLYIGAVQMEQVGRAWLAYDLSGSGLVLGQVALANGLIMAIVSLFAGAVADRYDKFKVLLCTHVAVTIISIVTAILVQLGTIQIWHLVVLGLLNGAVSPFSFPCRQAYLPLLVRKEDLANAVSVESMGKNLIRVVGPTIVGVLLGLYPAAAFWSFTALHVVTVLTLLKLPRALGKPVPGRSMLVEAYLGLAYLFKQPALRLLLTMYLVATVLGYPVQLLLPVFQVAVLNVTPAHLGVMYGSFGAGAFGGTALIAALSRHPRQERIQIASAMLLAASLVAFALSGNFLVAVVVLFFIGCTLQAFFTINHVLLMLATRSDMYGRMASTHYLVYSIMSIAMLGIGAMVDLIGAPVSVALLGTILFAYFCAVAVASPRHWRKPSHV